MAGYRLGEGDRPTERDVHADLVGSQGEVDDVRIGHPGGDEPGHQTGIGLPVDHASCGPVVLGGEVNTDGTHRPTATAGW